MQGKTLHVGSPTGPEVTVLKYGDGGVAFLSEYELQGDETLYDEGGWIAIELDGSSSSVVASLFESRTIQQVLDEDESDYDFGWKFIHLGWAVPFENGKSSYGQLVSLNQNRKGVGVQGPTSISGLNGSPLNLIQKVDITNSFEQVNGWKSSSTPTSFALDARDVQADDTAYVYADAYVIWNVEGVISTPGSNGAGLQEYPANNTVEVEI